MSKIIGVGHYLPKQKIYNTHFSEHVFMNESGELLKQDKLTTQLPASMLLLHPDVTVIIDEEAYEG